ncbi:MAG: methyl-accepting chemotaxis protein [Gammaproteobacteria bacterium]|nr:methyl-accepting chemotaxis protein [Gammaproteobacteria bacterium]
MRLSIGRKMTILISLVSLIFIVSLFVIKSVNTRIADLFEVFYKNDFLVSAQFEKLKETQVDIVLNIRGLQIAYLLNLTEQVDGYVVTIKKNYEVTPVLFKQLESTYAGDPKTLRDFEKIISTFQTNAKAFVDAMNSAPDNKAPFPVFSAFIKSYGDLGKFLNTFKQSVDASAQNTQTSIQSAIDQASILFYVAVFIAIAAASLLSWYISNGIRSGIKNVRDVALHLSKGDLTALTSVRSNDEIGDLGNAINETINHLRNTIAGIANSARIVSENSNTVLQFNSQVSQVTEDVTDNTNQVVTAIEEMSATSKNIAQNTTETAAASSDMQDLAHKGLSQSEHTIGVIADMVNGLNDTSDVVKKLQNEISNIETILEVIRGISEQTNLLALNAAIEAARAGEQGRGFAVVADEVRGLAQRSQNSVNEIESLLSELNIAGNDAVNRMSNSTEKADSARTQVEENNELIRQMLERIENVNAQAQQIATAAEEQSAVSDDISKNMHAVQSLTNQSAEIANKTNSHSEEMNQVSIQVLEQAKFFKV